MTSLVSQQDLALDARENGECAKTAPPRLGLVTRGVPGRLATCKEVAAVDTIHAQPSEVTNPAAAVEPIWPVDLTDEERASARLLPVVGPDDTITWTVVDADVYPALSLFRWRMDVKGYVRRTSSVGPTRILIVLHRFVMCCSTGDGLEIDHINRCKLDNRRVNLRYVTHAENMRNRPSWRDARRPHPQLVRSTGHWRAKFSHGSRKNKVTHTVGHFATYNEADAQLLRALAEHDERGCDRG